MCQSPNTYRDRFKKLTFSVNSRQMTLLATSLYPTAAVARPNSSSWLSVCRMLGP